MNSGKRFGAVGSAGSAAVLTLAMLIAAPAEGSVEGPPPGSTSLAATCRNGPGASYEGEYSSCANCKSRGQWYVSKAPAGKPADYNCTPVTGSSRVALGVCGKNGSVTINGRVWRKCR